MQYNKKGKTKSMLMLASVASMIDQFNMNNIEILQKLGYKVDVACNFKLGSTCSKERIDDLKKRLEDKGVEYYQIDFSRNVLNLLEDIKAYKQVKQLTKQNRYEFIHCHSPIGGVVGRIVSHETNTKVMYTAHGFHFYEGAPLINWLIFYPIEKKLSRWTDILITITEEDYNRARKKFYARRIVYTPGVGIDISNLSKKMSKEQIEEKKRSLGIPREACVILSVGELNKNKNHQSVIRAIAKAQEHTSIFYVIAGRGKLKGKLEKLAKKLNVNLLLLGYRQDVPEIYQISDIYIHPSFREGMSVATMEAAAAGKIILASKIRGEVDLIEGQCLFKPNDIKQIAEKINGAREGKYSDSVIKNNIRLQKFSIENISDKMYTYYGWMNDL